MSKSVRKTLFGAAALTFAVALSGCNMGMNFDTDGVPLAELDLSGDVPTGVALLGPDTVIISEGAKLDVQVEGPDDAVAGLRFKIDGGTLAIMREGDWKRSAGATIRVTMPAPSELSMAGSGSIQAAGMAKAAEINNAGSGSITVTNIAATRLEVSMAGSGDVTAAGTADTLEVSIAGSGTSALDQLKAGTADISIMGSGDVRLASDGKVEASIAGSGDVTVTGSATCEVSSVGSGTVTCRPATGGTAQTAKAAE